MKAANSVYRWKSVAAFFTISESAPILSTLGWPLLLLKALGKHLDHQYECLFADCSQIKAPKPVPGCGQPLLLHLFIGLLLVLVRASDRLWLKICQTEFGIADAKTGYK